MYPTRSSFYMWTLNGTMITWQFPGGSFSKTAVLLVDLWEKSEGGPAPARLVTAVTSSTHVQKSLLNLNVQSKRDQDFLVQVFDYVQGRWSHSLSLNCSSSKSRMIAHTCLTPVFAVFCPPRCGERGFCLEYDHDGLAKVLLGVLMVCKGVTTTTFFLSWLFSRRQTGYNNTRTTVEMALQTL